MKSGHKRGLKHNPRQTQFGNLPAALTMLMHRVGAQLGKLEPGSSRHVELCALFERLEASQASSPSRENFETLVCICHEFGYDRTESYLEFLYAVMRTPLTDYATGLLRRYNPREDAVSIAVDLAGSLFEQLAEGLLDFGDEDSASKRPPSENTVAWLYKAIRNDVLDYCKSGANRFEQAVLPGPEEGYEQAIDRLTRGDDPYHEDGSARLVEAAERREEFLEVFEYATSRLKSRHREVLHLRELEDCSIEEIAARTEMTPQQVQDTLQYGREKRAQLMAARFRAQPALQELDCASREVTALLKRVRLGSLAYGLRQLEFPEGRAGMQPVLLHR